MLAQHTRTSRHGPAVHIARNSFIGMFLVSLDNNNRCIDYLVHNVKPELLNALIIPCLVTNCNLSTLWTAVICSGFTLLCGHSFSDHRIIFCRSSTVIASACFRVAAAPFDPDLVLIASKMVRTEGARAGHPKTFLFFLSYEYGPAYVCPSLQNHLYGSRS